MKTKKYTLPVMIMTLVIVFGATTVFATTASAHYGKHVGGTKTLSLCNVAKCNTVGVHRHRGKYYSGHSVGDGHDYHTVCNVEGCTKVTKHKHKSATSSKGKVHH